MGKNYDVWVAGAGYAGAVSARALAERGKKVLVLERRDHIGGNAYDCLDEYGVLIHKYGPHIFHTNDKKVFDFLSRFTQWRDYQHRVAANIPDPEHPDRRGWRLQYPVPFNLTSLEEAFGQEEGKRLGDKLIAAYGAEKKVTILELRQNPDPEISAIADYVYEHVFVHYTMKQWGQKPEDIDPAVTGRVPVVISYDNRYFGDKYQGMPLDGFTPMGPWIVTEDEFPFPPKLSIQSKVNGELRQDSNTGLLIFGIPHVIQELSKGMTLKAGTVIAMGTPAGVGMGFDPPRFLKAGDQVECIIEGIGTLKNTVR